MKHLLKFIIFFNLFIPSVFSQEQDFTLFTQFNGSYDFVMIGNTLNVNENTFPFSCEVLSASSANLSLNDDQEIVGAYLYWSGSGDINNISYFSPILNNTNFNAEISYNIVFNTTNFQNIPVFGGIVNITDFIIENGNIDYEFTGIDISQDLIDIPQICGSGFNYLGWAIVVIYEDLNLDPVQLNIYNGFKLIDNLNPEINFNLNNLNITDTNNSSIGIIAWEGDSFSAVNETLQVNDFILGNPPLNPSTNIFNGTNSWTGSDELWNMDLDFFELDEGMLQVGDTSLNINVTSGQDRVVLHNFVTRISTELPDATIQITNLTGEETCDNRDLEMDVSVFNTNSTSTLPANVPISFFILDENGNEVFLFSEFTSNPILIGESEDFSISISIQENIPANASLIVRVNTDEFGNNPIQENNLQNNEFIYELNLLISPEPIQTQNLSQCSILSESFFNLADALAETPNPEDEISFHLSQEDAENDEDEITEIDNYNPTSLTETIYVRRFDGNCFAISQFEIQTLLPPQPITPEIFAECDFSEEQEGFTQFDLSSVIPEITDGNPNYEIDFFTNQADAEDLTIENGLTSPYTNENAFSQTLFVRATDVNNGCVAFTELELQIDLLPMISDASTIPALEQCDDDQNGVDTGGVQTLNLTSLQPFILNGLSETNHQIQYYTTQTDAENNENEILNPTAFESAGQTIFVRVTELETGCFSFTSFEIIVHPIPPLQPGETNFVCDLNDDGLATFFLPFALNSIIADPTGYTFQYFETLTDAENETNAIEDPNNYVNIAFPTQTLYALATDEVTGCQNIQSFDIEVVPADFIPFELVDLEVCAPSLDGIGIEIDLTEQEPFLFGTTNPTIYTTTYHFTQADAASGNNPILNPESFPTLENPQLIWVRIVNNIVNCVEIGSFNYKVLLSPIVSQPDEIEPFLGCSEDLISENISWNLAETIPFIYEISQGFSFDFYLSEEDALSNLNPLPVIFENTVNPQTLFVRVENLENNCFSLTSIELQVNTLPEDSLPEFLETCDTNNDGFSFFEIGNIITDIESQNPTFEVSFHLTTSDAETNSNPLPSIFPNVNAFEQIIFTRILDTSSDCLQIIPLSLFVRPSPLLNEIDPNIECDTNETGLQFFDLTQVEENLFVPGQNTEDFEISYHLSEEGANNNTGFIGNPTAFQNTSNPQTVYVRVEDPTSPLGCFNIEPIELIVDPLPEITPPTLIAECDDLESGSAVDERATFDLTEKIPEITNNDNALTVIFYASEEDQANDNPISNFEAYQNIVNPQTIEVSVFSPDTDCIATTTLTLVVDPLPTIPEPEPLIVCDADNEGTSEFDLLAAIEDILDGEVNTQISFHLTEVDANNGDNALAIEDENGQSILFQNFNPFTQTIYVRAENIGNANINGTGCFTIRPLELQVVESPRIEELEDLVICDDESLNGFAPFDLTQNTALAIGTQVPDNLIVTYHVTQVDAELGLNAISVPSNYTNLTNPQTIYVRLFDTETQCVDLFGFADDNSFTLTVEPYPDLITPTPLRECNSQANPDASFPTGTFDLTQKEEELTGLSPVPGNISFVYYESEEDLLNQENAIENPEEYINSAAPPMLIYVEAINTTTENQCSNSSTITLSVLPVPFPVDLTEEERRLTACDDDNDGVAAEPFDLTQIGQQITGSENNVGSYYLSLNAAIDEDATQQIANPFAYVNDPNLNELDENFFPTNTQIVWLRLDSNAAGNFCFTTVPIEIVVERNPELNPLGNPFGYTLCEGEPTQLPTADEIAFSLYDATDGSPNEIIPVLDPETANQDQADYQYSLHLTEAEAEAGTNALAVGYQATDGQTLYLRVAHLITGCYNIGNIAEVVITIEPRPEITDTTLTPIVVCADEQANDTEQAENQEVATIDLTERDAEIDPNFDDEDSNTIVEYFASEEDFLNGIAIEDPSNFTTTQTPTIIFAQVVDLDNFCASFTTQSFEIRVNPLPLVDISDLEGAIICINPLTGEVISTDFSPPVFDTGLSEEFYSFEWTLNDAPLPANGSSYTPTQAGTYTVTVTDITNNLTSCQASSTATILESNPPTFEVNVLSQAFDRSHSLEVFNIQGTGDYEFSIDNGPWQSLEEGQESIIFSGLDAGERIVRGRDSGGCGELTITVSLIDYPRFFTPNEDGYNDTWNIIGLANQPNAKIYIFDRHGKLLKQISPSGEGWNGTYNGKAMVGNDYWFRVEYDEPSNGARKEFKANFTLKR